MSTHSTVGRYEDQFGRYVHFDGYPDTAGVKLINLIRRDGVDNALSVLIDEHKYGWSSIDPDNSGSFTAEELSIGYDDGRFEAVEGYGVAYTGKQTWDEESCLNVNDTVYGYLIESNGMIHVYTADEQGEAAVINPFSDDAIIEMSSIE